jgi:hypothetical protein
MTDTLDDLLSEVVRAVAHARRQIRDTDGTDRGQACQ